MVPKCRKNATKCGCSSAVGSRCRAGRKLPSVFGVCPSSWRTHGRMGPAKFTTRHADGARKPASSSSSGRPAAQGSQSGRGGEMVCPGTNFLCRSPGHSGGVPQGRLEDAALRRDEPSVATCRGRPTQGADGASANRYSARPSGAHSSRSTPLSNSIPRSS